MEWNLTDIQSLAEIDRKIGSHKFSPAEYEITRRVIFDTADVEYKSLIRFSERSLLVGAAALAARTTIVVDDLMVQAGILPHLQRTFANALYCATTTQTRPPKDRTTAAWEITTLARRYPEAIFVMGKDHTALTALVELIELKEIEPAMAIGAPSGFVEANVAKERLQDSMIPNICIDGPKGSPVVAVAIFNALLDLAWRAYGENSHSLGL